MHKNSNASRIGKTLEDFYGEERAIKIKDKKSTSMKDTVSKLEKHWNTGRVGELSGNYIQREDRLCLCGCGQTFKCKVNSKKKYIKNHVHNVSKVFSAERRLNMSIAAKKRGKNSSGNTGHNRTSESKQRQSVAISKVIAKKFSTKQGFHDTKPELLMKSFLTELGYRFIHPYPVWNIKHVYTVDFYLPELKLAIEVDGKYWHNYPFGLEKDYVRTEEMWQAGYKVLRFWENEFDLEKVKSTIEDIQSPLICA